MVGLTMAQRGAGLHQLRGHRGLRQRHVERARTLQRQIQILLVQRNAKARCKLALDHALAMHLQNARRGKAAHQRLTHPRRVGTGLAGKGQRLADRSNVQCNDDLVRHLADLARAHVAHQGDVLAHQRKQRLHAIERGLRAADHDGQAGRLGADLAAGHRRVQVVAAQGLDALGKAARSDGVD